VNYLTESGNRAAPTCLEAGTNPLRVSVRRNRDTRKAGCAAASHEWEAVHEVFRASRPKFIGLAYSILRNKEDAEDAVQDAMLSAYRHLRSFKGRSAFTTWFTRIVFNAAFMIRRKRKPERIGSFPDSGETDETPWVERIPATQPDPEMVCAEAETFRAIDELLRKMNPVLRQAFTMAYYDEMSVEEALCSASPQELSRPASFERGNTSSAKRNIPSWSPSAVHNTRCFLPTLGRSRPLPQDAQKSRLRKLPSDDKSNEHNSHLGAHDAGDQTRLPQHGKVETALDQNDTD
jgi:RNA polymerase sigma-70 factor (ECF subfamily)